MESTRAKIMIRVFAVVTLVFLYVPLVIVVLYAFNDSVGQAWPIEQYTTKWFSAAWNNEQVREALPNSLEVAAIATLFALVLGSAAAFAVHRFRFFGRNSGLVPAGPADRAAGDRDGDRAATRRSTTSRSRSAILTIIIGHATFCIVVVYNNVLARLRRTPTSLIEASMDLGADGWQTFRYVTFPAIRTAIVAGALLAFALSFDEIVVTNFTAGSTLHDPEVHLQQHPAPARTARSSTWSRSVVILLMVIPVYIAQRMAGGGDVTATAATGGGGGGLTGR